MAKNKPTLPPRKWYSLQQAADKLTDETKKQITINDLLYYAINDYIRLCVYVNFSNDHGLSIGECIDYQVKCWRNTKEVDGKDDFTKPINIQITCNDIELEQDEEIERKYYKISRGKYDLSFKGLLCIDNSKLGNVIFETSKYAYATFITYYILVRNEKLGDVIHRGVLNNLKLNHGKLDEEIKIRLSHNVDFIDYAVGIEEELDRLFSKYDAIEINQKFKIDINLLYITDEDLDFLIELIARKKEIATSTLKEANQTEFIKALIKAHYDTDEPEKVRTLLGKNGELAKLFARKGIDLNVTPETVRNWLKTEK